MIYLGNEATLTIARIRSQINAALAALNDLSSTQLRTQADAALAAVDPVTMAEAVILNTKIDAISTKVGVLETHHHTQERWCGISGDQSGNNWCADNITVFRAISGNNGYGADANDEAKVIGSVDTPRITGNLFYDAHRLLVVAVSVNTVFRLRIVYGTGTMAAAIAAGQFTHFDVMSDDTIPARAGGRPVDVMMPRVAVETKLWIQAWNATNNATIDFLMGIHEYAE